MTPAGVEFRHQPELDGWTPPSFNARGDRFVAVNDDDLGAFTYPDCQPLHSPITAEDDDDRSDSVCYVDTTSGDRVLRSTNAGRAFLVNLEDGETIVEIAVEGHEPRPCYEVYTSLSRSDSQLCTDLQGLTAVGDNLMLSVHTNGKTTNRKDTLLFWRVPS